MITLLETEDILFPQEPPRYTKDGVSYLSVTEILRISGLTPDFSFVNEDRLALARQRGTAVHKACEWLNKGYELDETTVDDRLRGYLLAYDRFRRDCNHRIIAVEEEIISELPIFQCAGRLDVVAFINGQRSIVDIKTGHTLIPTVGIQLEAYTRLWDIAHPREPIHKRFGLHLKNDGSYRLIPQEDVLDLPVFLDALEFARFERKLKKWRCYYKQLPPQGDNGHG